MYFLRILLAIISLVMSGEALCCDEGHNENNQLSRFYELGDLVYETYQEGELKESRSLANEYLALAEKYKCDWNYGNAIHGANSFLGMISLSEGNVIDAKKYLTAAGKSPGSPQLNSYGPDFFLANVLLSMGEREVVVSYLLDINQFWGKGSSLVENWIYDIEAGEVPELDREAGIIDTVINQLYWLLPIFITIIYWRKLRSDLANVWAYPASSLIVGYSIMVLIELYLGNLLNYVAEVVEADYAFYLLIFLGTFIEVVVPILAMLLIVHVFRRKIVAIHG